MTVIDYWAIAEAMRADLIARRRDFHRYPELAFEEQRTSTIIADELHKLGLEVQTGVGGTGVVGILEGASDGPTVLVRSDMDALPVFEANDVDYRSLNHGKMHACGHDGHMSILLGLAKLFSSLQSHLVGRIKFVFQPAEEIGQGAQAMVRDGVLDDPTPDIVLGLHLWTELPIGSVGLSSGPIMAAVSNFDVHITGRGGHGGIPQDAVDPVVCAAHIITALQTIISRNVDPLDSAVLSVTRVEAGTTHNVIPETARLSGTLRTFKAEVRNRISERIQNVCTQVALALGCESRVEIHHKTEPVENTPHVVDRVHQAFKRISAASLQIVDERTTAGEDVYAFMRHAPGLFFFVGAANREQGLSFPHHHEKFDFDESALPLAVALMATAIGEYVIPQE